ncbi:hypothetical protein EOM09_04205, partial [bacterium]|nr:hypothetical protein [bacterium]
MNSKIFAAIGVTDFKSYLFKYFLPIFLFDFLLLFVFLFGFENPLFKWFGVSIFFLVFIFLFTYPSLIIDGQARDIE